MKMGVVRRVALVLCFASLSGCESGLFDTGGAVGPIGPAQPRGEWINESARRVPVVYDVDVVVVGDSSGAVAAAVAAAHEGATVFLSSRQTYLGWDIAGTYRLWLRPDEVPTSPLAQAVFAEPAMADRLAGAIGYEYTTDVPSQPPHKDSRPGSLLNDGKWHSAPSQSVQYNGDVTITADMGRLRDLQNVVVMVYQRDADFEIDHVAVEISEDGQQWRPAGKVKNERIGDGIEDVAMRLTVPVETVTRYVRIGAKKTERVGRILLGEVFLQAKRSDPAGEKPPRVPPSLMQVKRTLDKALLDAGVRFLYGCYPTDVLTNEQGQVAGIVVTNRSGRQAIRAKVVIDASSQAVVARLAGAKFHPWRGGSQKFSRVVVGGEAEEPSKAQVRKMSSPVYAADGRTYDAFEYTVNVPIRQRAVALYAQAEQFARDQSWRRGQVDASDVVFHVPVDRVRSRADACCGWPGADQVKLDVFRPRRVEHLYVLSGCADMSRRAAKGMLRPVEFMEVGQRVGAAAAQQAGGLSKPVGVKASGQPLAAVVAAGDVGDDPAWKPPAGLELGFVDCNGGALPVFGQYDVVVVGGGTGGGPAGISAARQGARTLVVEYLHGLGGVGTMGLIASYYYGNRVGFTAEVDQGVKELGGPKELESNNRAWDTQLKSEWFRRQLRQAGAEIWFGTLGCGAFVHQDRVKGVVVATEWGRGVVLADAVVDATGNAAVAAAAGAECIYTGGDHIAVQGTGLPPRQLGVRYTNTDYTFIDDIDVFDAWRAFVTSKEKYESAYDLGQLIDTRERRQIVGDFFLTPTDAYKGRAFPDTIVYAHSNFDSHGFTIHPMFMLRPPDRKVIPTYVPYRCLLPKNVEGVLVTGLAVSAHRDVMPVIRMQADIQNQGYAAGMAAAMASAEDGALRDVDIERLQRRLAEAKILDPNVVAHEDSFPVSQEEIRQAVEGVVKDYDGVETLFADPNRSLPLLREAYRKAVFSSDKLAYARALGIMNDPTGVETLVEETEAQQWDQGWKYTGMGQFGLSMSPVDSLIVALGRTRIAAALKPIVHKVEQLGPGDAFSHHRAVAMALETMGDPGGAKPLVDLLSKPQMTGHAFTDLEVARKNIQASSTDNTTREHSLRELVLARSLYRCGDYEGLGEKILREYARDLRGHYRRHAQAVLAERPGSDR